MCDDPLQKLIFASVVKVTAGNKLFTFVSLVPQSYKNRKQKVRL